jgi:hypothetical protein
MATTQSLNSDDSIEVTTFSGGVLYGRCYEFTDTINKQQLVLTERQLLDLINRGEFVPEGRRIDVRAWANLDTDNRLRR